MLKRFVCLLSLVVIVAGTAAPASAQRENRGIQGGFSGDLDWYVGLRAETETIGAYGNRRTMVDFNWFFPPGDGFNYFDFNFNYLWPLAPVVKANKPSVYVGAGLNVGRGWVSDSDDSVNWEFGMNVLGGFTFETDDRTVFVEAWYTFITDFDQWRVGAGFMF